MTSKEIQQAPPFPSLPVPPGQKGLSTVGLFLPIISSIFLRKPVDNTITASTVIETVYFVPGSKMLQERTGN